MKKICLFIICLFLSICVVKAENITTRKNNCDEEICEEECINQNEECITEENNDGLLNDGKSAILIEASTGKILYEKNSHDRYAPASMTKIMSMILIMESIESGKLKWNDTLITSNHAASMGGSQIFLQPNEKMKVKDLFKAVAIGSANDVAVIKKQSQVIGEEITI